MPGEDSIHLRFSGANLFPILDLCGDVAVLLNKNGIIEYVNKSMCQLLNYQCGELTGQSVKTIVHPDYHAQVQRDIEHVVAGEELDDAKYLLVGKEGTTHKVEVQARRINDNAGNFQAVLFVAQDVTTGDSWKSHPERLAYLMENLATGVVYVEGEQIVEINRVCIGMFGYDSRDEMLGMRWDELVAPQDADHLREALRRVLAGEERLALYKCLGRRRDGSTFHCAISISLGHGGWRPVALVLVSDISQEVQAAEALRQVTEQLQRIMDTMPAIACRLSPAGETLFVNKYVEVVTGYTPEELIGRNWWEVLYPGDEYEQVERVLETLEHEDVHNYAMTLTTKNGEKRIVSWNSANEWDEQGRLQCINGIGIEVSEHRRMEQEIHRQRDRIQQYLDIAGVILLSLDTNGTVTLINKKGCEILGWSEEEILGKDWFSNFVPESHRQQVKLVFERLKSGYVEELEYFENPVLTKDGEQRIIAWHNSVLTDAAGNFQGLLASGEDITERRQIEEQLRQAARMEAIGQLTAGITHDFNNMLTVIMTQIELMELTMGPNEDLQILKDAAERF